MGNSVQDKVVVITGAGGGIGREMALAMAANGARVVVNDIGAALGGELSADNAGAAQKVVNEIKAAGGQAVASTDSVATWDSAARIIQCAVDTYGRIDAVINNAGILRDRIFHKMSEDDWRSVLSVHLDGAFYMSRAAANPMRSQNSGAFVHMTSTSGLIGNFGQANYSAAKLGIAALSKSIALDLSRHRVRSNCIAPFAWSRMTSSIPANTPEEKERAGQLMKMEARKVAPMAVFLVSDAAAEVTGQIFGVRANEIMLFSQPRPIRSVHYTPEWTPEAIAQVALPAMQRQFYPLERSPDVVSWDPI